MKGKILPILSVLFLIFSTTGYYLFKDSKSITVHSMDETWEVIDSSETKLMKKKDIDYVTMKLKEGKNMGAIIELGSPDRLLTFKDSNFEYRIWFDPRSDSFIYQETGDTVMYRVHGATQFNSIIR